MRISVCAPYWNRQAELDRMVATYDRLYDRLDLEFSLCDDGSTPPMRPPPGVQVVTHLPVKTGPKNPCVPINRAVKASTGDLIALTSPEIAHDAPVLMEMRAAWADVCDYVIAPCFVPEKRVWLSGPRTDYAAGGRGAVPPGGHFHFLVLFHRQLWERAGGFDESYRAGQGYDDNDWLWRAYAAGARFQTVAGIVRHPWEVKRRVRWHQLPSNRALFERRWPAARRAALVQARGA